MRLCCADLAGDMCAVFGRPGVQYNKANRSITELYLYRTTIDDKGACALADALRATLVTSFSSRHGQRELLVMMDTI